MPLLVTGSIGIDTVTSPYGRADSVLGGSAVYFAFAAGQFAPVRLVALVGGDFPPEFHDALRQRNIDLSGLEKRPRSQTFRWRGHFEADMREAQTLEVDLNVLAEPGPKVPDRFADSKIVFLGNTHPVQQRELLAQVHSPMLVACDTMNLWITTERESLLETLSLVHGVILNDAEARQLTDRVNLIEAGEAILDLGPRFVVIKKGEHGALLISREGVAAVPAYPARVVRDPTGAGDSFAGGMLGYLASVGRFDFEALRQSLVRGTVTASFTIEDFSLRRLQRLTRIELDARCAAFVRMLRFD